MDLETCKTIKTAAAFVVKGDTWQGKEVIAKMDDGDFIMLIFADETNRIFFPEEPLEVVRV